MSSPSRRPLGRRAVFDVDEPPVLGDDASIAVDVVSVPGAVEGSAHAISIVGMDQRQPGFAPQILWRVTEPHFEALRRRVDDDLSVGIDAGMEGEVGRQVADQTMEGLALAQTGLFDQESLAGAVQVAAQPTDHEVHDEESDDADPGVDQRRPRVEPQHHGPDATVLSSVVMSAGLNPEFHANTATPTMKKAPVTIVSPGPDGHDDGGTGREYRHAEADVVRDT